MTTSLRTVQYNRDAIVAGIAHIGVGNFHRSHQARYVHELLKQGAANDWGICGIGLLPGDTRMRDALRGQDFIYTLVEKHADGTAKAEQIGSIIDMVLATESPETVLEVLSDPSIRIVSLTITEGGYNIDQNGEFDLTNPVVQEDLRNPERPTTAFGFISAALQARRHAGTAPFTVMSCDNLPGNGDITRLAVTSYAREVDPALADWIDTHVTFPNSMVDRITPVTTDADRYLVQERCGIHDAWPVMCEPFSQWVLEDRFAADRPPLEDAGVQIVPDVVPYELMKLRLLNASHQALAYIGIMAGYEWVHDAVEDERIHQFLRAWMAEARQTLPATPGIDVDDYCQQVMDRFSNRHIADTLGRLAVDASDRIPKFVIPAVRENLSAGRPAPGGAILLATWARYLALAPTPSSINDPGAQSLWERVHAKGSDPATILEDGRIFAELGDNEHFRDQFEAAYSGLQEHQPLEALADLLELH